LPSSNNRWQFQPIKHQIAPTHHLAHSKQSDEDEESDDDEATARNLKMKKLEKMAKKAAEEEEAGSESEDEKEATKEDSDDEDDGVSAKVPHKINKIKIESSGISSKNLKFMSRPKEDSYVKKTINQNKGKKFLPYWDNEIIGEYAVDDLRRTNPNAYDWVHYPPQSRDQYMFEAQVKSSSKQQSKQQQFA